MVGYMGNAVNNAVNADNADGNGKIVVDIKKKTYKVIMVNIPYNQLRMIRVLQREFDHEVKGTIYVDSFHKFKSFEIRTDNSEIYSYGASDWRISFHTHPDKTAQKYGIRYFSPPSVDDVMEIYDYTSSFVPDTTQRGFGEISIIFANEGIYVLQVNRDSFAEFNKDNLPMEGLEAILEGTLTDLMATEIKKGIRDGFNDPDINDPDINDPDINDPDITVEHFADIVKRMCSKVSKLYGFDMSFHSWLELKDKGLRLDVCDYFLNKKVTD